MIKWDVMGYGARMKKNSNENMFKVMLRYPLEICLVILLSILILFVFEQVVSRYLFRHIEIWAAELQQGLFVWCSLIASVIALREGQHYSATYFIDKLSPLTRNFADLINHLLIGLAIIILIWYGIDSTKIAGMQDYIGLPFSRMPQYISLPICSALMFFYLISRIYRNVSEIINCLSNRKHKQK